MLNEEKREDQLDLSKPFSRRKSFGIMGAGTAMMVAAASCKKEATTALLTTPQLIWVAVIQEF